MPLVGLPVLIDPIITLRLLHHWIISRKFSPPATHPAPGAAEPRDSDADTERREARRASVRRPTVRRELSLPADERAIVSQLEAQLVPQVRPLHFHPICPPVN